MTHIPALDQLRGVAVLVVVAFHLGWLDGGYLGVSTFFALSGFLITTLLVNEFESTGAVSLRSFWARRFRRLMPAALATIAGVALYAVTVEGEALDGQYWAALGYAANWYQLATTDGYGALFAEPHPLEHFWSLAIEEQFYVAWPLAALGALKLGGRRGIAALAGATLAAGTLFSLLLPADTAYLVTHTRMAELAVGALAAVVPMRFRAAGIASEVVRYGGLAALVGAAIVFDLGDASGLFLPLHGVVAALTVMAWVPTQRSIAPGIVGTALGATGKVSYGLYLWHWPAIVWFDDTVAIATMVVVTAASYYLIEAPVRFRPTRRKVIAATAVPIAILVALAPADATDHEVELVEVAIPTTITSTTTPPSTPPADTEATTSTSTTTTTQPAGPVTILVVGDSTATFWGDVLVNQTRDDPDITVHAEAEGGCSIISDSQAPWVGVQMVFGQGAGSSSCMDWKVHWAELIETHQPDIVLYRGDGVNIADIHLSDVVDDQSGDTVLNVLADRDVFAAELAELRSIVHAGGAELWVMQPLPLAITTNADLGWEWINNDHARTAVWDELLTEAADHVIPTTAWFDAQPEDPRWDGVHLAQPAREALAAWVLPQMKPA